METSGDVRIAQMPSMDPEVGIPIPRTWHWAQAGLPPEAGITEGVGAIRVRNPDLAMSPSPMAFVRGTKGNLWMISQSSPLDWKWTDQSGVFDEGVGVAALNDGPGERTRPYVFVRAGDDLWCNWWTGAKWAWTDQGTPPRTTLHRAGCRIGAGTITPSRSQGTLPFAAVLDKNGRAWVNWWNYLGQRWEWTILDRPEAPILPKMIGAVVVTDPSTGTEALHVYAICGDSHLWRCVWDLKGSAWTDLGKPPGPLTRWVGPVAVQSPGKPNVSVYVFIVDGVDGRLYVNVTDAAAPRWEDAGMPPDEGRPNLGLGAGVVQPQAGREYSPVAMVTDHDAGVWADMGVGSWWWGRLGKPVGGIVVEQVGAVVITTDPTVTQTHVLMRTLEGTITDAWYG
ncbi:hypothetical protein ABZT47_27900 [Sphaerisporangium sp. NPDC005289]|uniref:hypothetical protein n=1 Tax=Sphaerisporangium sp. NPDC005289 TaxID=3155247 RepID=UPI0033AEE8F7